MLKKFCKLFYFTIHLLPSILQAAALIPEKYSDFSSSSSSPFRHWGEYCPDEVAAIGHFAKEVYGHTKTADEMGKFKSTSSETPYHLLEEKIIIGSALYQGVLFAGPFDYIGGAYANPDRSRIIIAFRGSQTFDDWRQNFRFPLINVDFPPMAGKVHQGFWTMASGSVLNMQKAIGLFFPKEAKYSVKLIQDFMASSLSPSPEIIFCGHSLGGAMAVLTATMFRDKCDKVFGGLKPHQYKVVTFSAPHIGDKPFTDSIHTRIPQGDILTFKTFGDPVPRILRNVFSRYAEVGHVIDIGFEDLVHLKEGEEGGIHFGSTFLSYKELKNQALGFYGALFAGDVAGDIAVDLTTEGSVKLAEVLEEARDAAIDPLADVGESVADAAADAAFQGVFSIASIFWTHRSERKRLEKKHKEEDKRTALLIATGNAFKRLHEVQDHKHIAKAFARWRLGSAYLREKLKEELAGKPLELKESIEKASSTLEKLLRHSMPTESEI